MKTEALFLTLEGPVQGVGLRPWLAQFARSLGLTGWVANAQDSVQLLWEGSADSLTEGERALRRQFPAARVRERRRQEPQPFPKFSIVPSLESGGGLLEWPLDLAQCAACRGEMLDPSNRRYLYPFTHCASCGPRYSLMEGMPFDRERTALKAFPPCEACRAEYGSLEDRRYHAQTLSCRDCGPRYWFESPSGSVDDPALALERAVSTLEQGGILGVLSTGGLHLLVDATSESAVGRLRALKARPEKPLAVLFPGFESAAHFVKFTDAEARAVTSPAAPIVLARKGGAALASNTAPGVPWLGVMLPSNPLEDLLAHRFGRPLVATSGNLSGEPLCAGVEEARERLGARVDGLLLHNRAILHPVDDTVVRFVDDTPVVLRAGRGWAPIVGTWSSPAEQTVLALGGHLKNASALAHSRRWSLEPYLGDLDGERTRDRFHGRVRQLVDKYAPSRVVGDLHPTFGTRGAVAGMSPAPHHLCHALATATDRGVEARGIAFAWDGFGLGPKEEWWGGETLELMPTRWRRLGGLRPLPALGGEGAFREPRRWGLALAREAGVAPSPRLRQWFSEREWNTLVGLPAFGHTSSMGRLFDGVAALLGGVGLITYEGQGAMWLEGAAEEAEDPLPLEFAFVDGEWDWRPMVRALSESDDPKAAALGFHHWLVDGVVRTLQERRPPAAFFGGGCFQNGLLVRLLKARAGEVPCPLHFPHRVPQNDGSLALGQLAFVKERWEGVPCA